MLSTILFTLLLKKQANKSGKFVLCILMLCLNIVLGIDSTFKSFAILTASQSVLKLEGSLSYKMLKRKKHYTGLNKIGLKTVSKLVEWEVGFFAEEKVGLASN